MTRTTATVGWVLGTIMTIYGMIYVDVLLRARESYHQAEQFMYWADHPAERAAIFDQKYAVDKASLDQQLAKGLVSKDDYSRSLELLDFDRDQSKKESSLKYAYVWYETTVDLFSPPDSKWVRMAREKMPIARERWKAELRAQNIPFEDYMIQ